MYCCTQFFQKLLGNVHIGLPAGKCRIFRSVRDENRAVSNSSMTSRSCADQAAAGTNPTSIHASSQDQSLGAAARASGMLGAWAKHAKAHFVIA